MPGAAEEIISWVTQETKHRRDLELTETRHRRELEKKEFEHRRRMETKGMELAERALNAGISRANIGMLLAWPLVIGLVGIGTFLIYTGNGLYGTILAESGLAIVVGAFVLQKIERSKRSEQRGKDQDLNGDGSEKAPHRVDRSARKTRPDDHALRMILWTGRTLGGQPCRIA